MSYVGQAYGGLSAIASSLALVAIAASFWLQQRQHRMEAIASLRSFQFHAYDLVRSDPATYGPVIGFLPFSDPDWIRRHTLYVQHMQYLAASYEMGLVNEAGLVKDSLRSMFDFTSGREYWLGASDHWKVPYTGAASQRFIKIVDEALARAMAEGPGMDPEAIASDPPVPRGEPDTP